MKDNEKKLKVAIFSDSFYPGVGGTERAVFEYAKTLSKTCDVAVFAPNYHRSDNISYPFKVFRAKSIAFGNNDFFALPKLDKKIKKALKGFSPDIIHNQTPGMMADFANGYAKKNNLPIIITLHTKYSFCYEEVIPFKFINKMIMKRIGRRIIPADRIFSVSYSMKNEMELYGVNKDFSVIKNGCEIKKSNEEEKQKNEIPQLLYVGLVAKRKNLEFSLKALSLLKKQGTDFVFHIIGRGKKNYFLKKAKKLGLENNVFFHGQKKPEELASFYKNADLFLFPSIFDTDGLVLIEAGAYNTPSVVLKNTGASERFVDCETGFISEQDEVSFANKITWCLNNREILLKVGKNSKTVVKGWDTVVEEYLKIYKEELLKKSVDKK